MKQRLSALLSIFLCIFMIPISPSNAIQGGVSAKGDSNAVAVGFGGHGGCGGFLYAPRIVFTAQHCLHNPLTKPATLLEPYQLDVFSPGTTSDRSISGEKYFIPSGFSWYNTNGYSTFGKDFAVLVLEKPHVFQGETKIADRATIDQYIRNQNELTIVGFGKRFKDDIYSARPPMKSNFKLASEQLAAEIIQEYKTKFGRNGIYGPTVHAYIPKGDVMTCDGDSGAPLFYREGSVTTYVGASSTIAGTLNCGADENWGEKGGMQSVEPAYLYMDLVNEAEEYVKDHPYLGERIRITCTSGKKSIEVFDPNPVCPKGFTLFLKNGLKPKQGVKCDQFGVIAGNFTCASLEGKNLWFKITLDKSTNKRPIAGRKCLTNELEAMGYDKFGDMTSLICTFKNAPGSFPSWLPE